MTVSSRRSFLRGDELAASPLRNSVVMYVMQERELRHLAHGELAQQRMRQPVAIEGSFRPPPDRRCEPFDRVSVLRHDAGSIRVGGFSGTQRPRRISAGSAARREDFLVARTQRREGTRAPA